MQTGAEQRSSKPSTHSNSAQISTVTSDRRVGYSAAISKVERKHILLAAGTFELNALCTSIPAADLPHRVDCSNVSRVKLALQRMQNGQSADTNRKTIRVKHLQAQRTAHYAHLLAGPGLAALLVRSLPVCWQPSHVRASDHRQWTYRRCQECQVELLRPKASADWL